MSLPSRAIFYKGEVPVGSLFVNCGWWINEEAFPRLVKNALVESPKKDPENIYVNGWDNVVLYGGVYSKADLDELDRISNIKRERREKEYLEYKKTETPTRVLIPIIRKMPVEPIESIVDLILSVQPITAPVDEVLKIKMVKNRGPNTSDPFVLRTDFTNMEIIDESKED